MRLGEQLAIAHKRIAVLEAEASLRHQILSDIREDLAGTVDIFNDTGHKDNAFLARVGGVAVGHAYGLANLGINL